MTNPTSIFAQKAKAASEKLGTLNDEQRIKALNCIKEALKANEDAIYKANAIDLENAKNSGLEAPLLKRLKFDSTKLNDCISGIDSLISLPNSVGIIQKQTELDNNLILSKESCPLGVIGIIFESRPDALIQISTLCVKSANACILKGGIEALNTNLALSKIIADATIGILPDGWIHLIETRQDVQTMLKMDEYIDLIIPRGSNAFVKYVMDNTHIPVMGHADGICHIYVDKEVDVDQAAKLSEDSKCQYPAVCNAVETILVHEDIAGEFLPKLKTLLDKHNTEIRGCEITRKFINCVPATEQDWATEYLDYIVSIKVVKSLDEAITHINAYGSGHTDAIYTKNFETAEEFMNRVKSADAFLNCSTRFADGFRFGLGAEVGISTSKLHARGPVGVEGLLTYKWKLRGNGQIVADYVNGTAHYTHKPII